MFRLSQLFSVARHAEHFKVEASVYIILHRQTVLLYHNSSV